VEQARTLITRCEQIQGELARAAQRMPPGDRRFVWLQAIRARLLSEKRRLVELVGGRARVGGSSRRRKHLSTKLPEYLDPDLLQASAAVGGVEEQVGLRLPKMGETDPPAEVGFDE